MTLPSLPSVPQPQLPPSIQLLRQRQAELERQRALLVELRSRRAARGVVPTERPELDPNTLTPNLNPQPEEVNREGFLSRLHSLAETGAGVGLAAIAGGIPGQQDFLNEEEFRKNYQEAADEIFSPSNPWQFIRQAAMVHAEALRRTDLPSTTIDIIPGSGVNLPWGGTLNEVSLGVKGALEVVFDPLNLLPAGLIAKVGVKAAAQGLKRAGMGIVVEAVESGRHAASEALASGKQLLPNQWKKNIATPTDLSGPMVTDVSIPGTTSVRGVRAPDTSSFIRPKSHEFLVESIKEQIEKIPKWVKRIKDSDRTLLLPVLGPMRWAFSHVNPITMMDGAGGLLSRKIRLSTFVHQLQHVDSPNQVEYSLRSLGTVTDPITNAPPSALFSKEKGRGWFGREEVPGVFDIDDKGRITNLVNPDGTLQNLTATKYGETTANQYAVFEGAFKGTRSYGLGSKFRYRGKDHLITELPKDEILRLVGEGRVSVLFVDQAFAVKHVQDWFKEARKMLDEFGVEVKDVFVGDDALAYVHKLATGRDDILFPRRRKTTGAVQPQERARTYTDETFQAGIDDGLQYEPNFLLSAREFSDAIYQSIRDKQLRNVLESHSYKVRDEFLPPYRRAMEATKKQVSRLEKAVKSIVDTSNGLRLKGAQIGALRRLGGELGFDYDNARALDVTKRHADALKAAQDAARKIAIDAVRMRKLVSETIAKSVPDLMNEVGTSLGLGAGVITDQIGQTFPAFSRQLADLAQLDAKLSVTPAPKITRKTTAVEVPAGDPLELASIGARPGEVVQQATGVVVTTETRSGRLLRRKRKALRDAINRDLKEAVRTANRTKAIAATARRTDGRVTGPERVFLTVHYPEVLKRLDSAVLEDAVVTRKQRLVELRKVMEKELKDTKEAHDINVGKFKSEARRYVGGVHLQAGARNAVTGKHDLKILGGEEWKMYEGESLIISEASQQRLPYLSGMFFEEVDIKQIENALLLPEVATNPQILKAFFLRTAPAAGDLARVLKAGFDFGAPFLQGIPVLARRPDIWAKATVRHMKVAAKGGQVHTRYLQENMDVLREMIQANVPFSGAASDYFVALQRGGVLPKVGQSIEDVLLKGSDRLAARATRGGGRIFADIGSRFENSFEAFGDYARIEMWKSLRGTAAKSGPEGINELAAFIRNVTGALNAGSLGTSPSQQALERGWLFFSPRYTRASLALIADAFQGGLRGQQARQTFAQLLAGGAAVYAGFATALGQEIRLDPRPKSAGGNGAEFMSLEIGGSHVGVGSFWTSFMRLLGGTATTAMDNPAALAKPSTRDNPIARWLRSRSAPMTGGLTDWINGANFLGEPLETPVDWTKHIARQTLPFTIENAIYDDGPIFGRLTVNVPTEFFGGRTFPIAKIEQRNEEREIAARERFEKGWDELNGLQKDEVENDPNRPLGRLSAEVREEAGRLRPADPRTADGMIDKWFADKEKIELSWRSQVKNGVKLFADGQIDTVVFKERHLGPANNERRILIGDLAEDESFREVEDYFAQLADKAGPVLPEERAFIEYIEVIVSSDDFEDPVIGFDFRARDAAERRFGDKWGQEILAYVRERFKAARESYDFQFPALIDELYIGRENFEWYWRDVEFQVLQQQPDPDTTISMYESWLKQTPTVRTVMEKDHRELREFLKAMSRTRRILREKNAELDAFMYRWGFTDTLAHKDNDWEGSTIFWRMAPAMSFPLPVQEIR